ncbi:hypothetical protein BpHYR1_045549 [Brachionus plicatilis]|uniref:Uncharacterized protein n=1 Tax=Brachionus plicatilis TaxID=10195 RepID=A0A3M7Q5U6_BRAPC|nr:hypothetical protein BpHYR1_045549 [Brachionus plicatilis]
MKLKQKKATSSRNETALKYCKRVCVGNNEKHNEQESLEKERAILDLVELIHSERNKYKKEKVEKREFIMRLFFYINSRAKMAKFECKQIS